MKLRIITKKYQINSATVSQKSILRPMVFTETSRKRENEVTKFFTYISRPFDETSNRISLYQSSKGQLSWKFLLVAKGSKFRLRQYEKWIFYRKWDQFSSKQWRLEFRYHPKNNHFHRFFIIFSGSKTYPTAKIEIYNIIFSI